MAPRWLRGASEWSLRLLVIGVFVYFAFVALGFLRVVVLPIIVALLVTTLLLPPKRLLERRGLPPAAATALTMIGMVVLLAGIGTAIAPSIGSQVSDLGTGVQDGVRKATRVLADEPFNLSRRELNERVDAGLESLRENSDRITSGVTAGAIVLGEIITALIVAILLTFFFLKDGRAIWTWLIGLVARSRLQEADELGSRVFAALAGYVRGLALVGLVDAVLIGIALLIIGVPLVVPLMILTFLAAFMPLIGAFLAGLAAVLIALVSNGVVAALLVLAAIVAVQQLEGHVLYPILMSRTVHLHPAAIIVALTAGGVVAGIIGVFLAVPVAATISTIISFVRDAPPPDPPLAEEEAGTGAGADGADGRPAAEPGARAHPATG
jgi:predicted PurR-regulated permease PerM